MLHLIHESRWLRGNKTGHWAELALLSGNKSNELEDMWHSTILLARSPSPLIVVQGLGEGAVGVGIFDDLDVLSKISSQL